MQRSTIRLTLAASKKWVEQNWPLLAGIVVALFVVGPLFQPGYVLSYDMVFSPHVFLDTKVASEGYALYSAIPMQAILKILSLIVPMDVVQKLVLVGIFFLSIYSFYRTFPVTSRVARFLGGSFYSLNPFTYDRLMAGQWKFLLAYSLTPFVLKVFWNVCTKPSRRTIIAATLTWTGVAIINAHHLLILEVLFVGIVIVSARSWRAFGAAFLTNLGTFLLSSWWLIPLLSTPNITHNFGIGDFQTFIAKPDITYGIWPTLISLQGFWFHNWKTPGELTPLWPAFLFILLILAIGVGTALAQGQDKRRFIIGLGLSALASLLFVAGPGTGYGDATLWVLLHVPGFSGLREPQKLIALLALFYAAAITFGVAVLVTIKRRLIMWFAVAASCASILAFGWPLLWCAHNQLTVSSYPPSWQVLYDRLRKEPSDVHALVLPYDLYMDKTFAGRLVADPAPVYFGDRVLASNDPQLSGVVNFQTANDQLLHQAIASHNIKLIREQINRQHIRYLILINSNDLVEYEDVINLPHTIIASDKMSTILLLTKP